MRKLNRGYVGVPPGPHASHAAANLRSILLDQVGKGSTDITQGLASLDENIHQKSTQGGPPTSYKWSYNPYK